LDAHQRQTSRRVKARPDSRMASNMSLQRRFVLVVGFGLGLLGGAHAGAPVPGLITVNDAGDADSDDSVCTLREAIIAADNQGSYHGCVNYGFGRPTWIVFNIPGSGVHQIAVASRLPEITKQVILDGLSQPGADCSVWPPTLLIEISSAGNGPYNGLTLSAGSNGSRVRGLVINGFNNNVGYADNFNAAINIYQSHSTVVECNFLGTDPTGTTAVPNLRAVDINNAGSNVITRNVMSGNTDAQVDMRGSGLNQISGNFIGTDVTGTVGLGGGSGVVIRSNPVGGAGEVGGNFIGWDGFSDPALTRNIISGFTGAGNAGVVMEAGAIGNRVAGNYIGTDVTGMLAIPNFSGVSLGSVGSNYHNIVGNDGTQDAASARNVISGNSFVGIDVNGADGTHDNAIVGNYIGMNSAGTATLPNGSYGISIDFASANSLVARNWLAGQGTAIRFFGMSGFGGNSTASFINNSGGANAELPSLDSSDNCVLGGAGVLVYAQGANVPNPNTFQNNWWGAATGPNTAGASSADGSIAATPYLTTPASVCSAVIFSDGFDPLP
jgi:CSLREA domain-containing protein